MAETTQLNLLRSAPERISGMNAYIDGKMKRYSLMFAVNGGAFALAKLLPDPNASRVLGGLSMEALAVGAILFTMLMWRDIYLFGDMMRREFFGGELVFQSQGKLILHALCSLVIVGWLLVAFWQRHGCT